MFANSFAAIAFVVIPFLIVLYFFRFKDRGKIWAVFQKEEKWKDQINASDSGFFFWRKTIAIFSIIFIIIALMRPQYGERYETIERDGRMIFFIVDTSLSMLAEDGAVTRMDLAKYHIQQLLPKLDDDMVSIIPYSNIAYTFLPLTIDKSAIDMFVNELSVGITGSSGTDVMNALNYTKNVISKTKSLNSSLVIILSDGEFYPEIDESNMKKVFDGMGIESIVIGLGSTQGEPIPLRNDDDQIVEYKKNSNGKIVLSKKLDAELEKLSQYLGGIYIDGKASPLIAEKIYSYMSSKETQKLESKQLVTKIDRYHIPLIISLLLLIADILYPILDKKIFYIAIMVVTFMSNPNKVFALHPGVQSYIDTNYTNAEIEFNKELINHPEDGQLIYNLGNTYFKNGKYEKAIKAYTESIHYLDNHEKIDALYNIGTSQLALQNFDEAINTYKAVLKQDPNHLKAKQNLELALRQQQENNQEQQNNNQKQTQDNQEPKGDDQDQSQSNQQQDNEEDSRQDEADKAQGNDSQMKDSNNAEDATLKKNSGNLTENQLQYLVNEAEKSARQKQKKKIDQLFREGEW